MSSSELDHEIASGVAFWGYEADGALLGIMGIQPVRDVDLIRHAYVLPDSQRNGVGGALLEHLRGLSARPMLVGTVILVGALTYVPALALGPIAEHLTFVMAK